LIEINVEMTAIADRSDFTYYLSFCKLPKQRNGLFNPKFVILSEKAKSLLSRRRRLGRAREGKLLVIFKQPL
jgi:hypothetical protein